jgi:hypothetical protein
MKTSEEELTVKEHYTLFTKASEIFYKKNIENIIVSNTENKFRKSGGNFGSYNK